MAEKGIAGVTKVIPALIARTQLGQILERVSENQDRFLISRRGKAQAVIFSVEDYLRTIVKQPEAITKLRAIAKEKGLDNLSMAEIDAEIAPAETIWCRCWNSTIKFFSVASGKGFAVP